MWSIPVHAPGPMGYVYAYALELRDGLLLIDAGWDTDAALASLAAGLGTFGARITEVRGAIFTHAHLDHYGLAGRVRDVSGAWLALHPRDAATLRRSDPPAAKRQMQRWLLENGVGISERHELLAAVKRRLSDRGVPAAWPDRLLADGVVTDAAPWKIETVETPGHSPGHVCFIERAAGIAFTGDHILSHSTPNVGVFPGSYGSPLHDYMTSLERMSEYGDALALPGHEERIPIGARVKALLGHHHEQLTDVRNALASGAATVREAAEAMRWNRPWRTFGPFDKILALAEARAHLVVIERRGEVFRKDSGTLIWVPRLSEKSVPDSHAD